MIYLSELWIADTFSNSFTSQTGIVMITNCFSYVISGDADGKVFVWDWKTTRVLARWKAHQSVCSSVLWHPHETSKIASAGWDGLIKFWD